MEAKPDIHVAGHIVIDQTMQLVARNFYWLEMVQDIEDYVWSCEDC